MGYSVEDGFHCMAPEAGFGGRIHSGLDSLVQGGLAVPAGWADMIQEGKLQAGWEAQEKGHMGLQENSLEGSVPRDMAQRGKPRERTGEMGKEREGKTLAGRSWGDKGPRRKDTVGP